MAGKIEDGRFKYFFVFYFDFFIEKKEVEEENRKSAKMNDGRAVEVDGNLEIIRGICQRLCFVYYNRYILDVGGEIMYVLPDMGMM